MKEAKRHSDPTVDAVAKALHLFEEYSNFKDFRAFHYAQAIGFKRYLAERSAIRSGQRLSKSTMYATLQALKRFFEWLCMQPGYRSSFSYPDAQYFNLSDKDTRIATAQRNRPVPTIQQIMHVIHSMPALSDIERRNRALIPFTLLTGARDGAIALKKLKHLNLEAGLVEQPAREVKTKFSKTFVTYFFPVGEDMLAIVTQRAAYLREQKLWGNDDPLFPASKVALNIDRQFALDGLSQKHWSSVSPIRQVFKESFCRAGLAHFNPHSFRNTLVQLGQKRCKSPEDFKAWSQNLGHEKVLTTFSSYGEVARNRQGAILKETAQLQEPARKNVTLSLQDLAVLLNLKDLAGTPLEGSAAMIKDI